MQYAINVLTGLKVFREVRLRQIEGKLVLVNWIDFLLRLSTSLTASHFFVIPFSANAMGSPPPPQSPLRKRRCVPEASTKFVPISL